METSTYLKRRDEIRTYFDRTALDAWKRLTSTEKVSGIRATVRAGRAEMRAEILSRLPHDLTGWRILDAGCGGGGLAVEMARRGADVLGIDLSPQMIGHALDGLPVIPGPGHVTLIAGDMLSPAHGHFDAIVSMDALIHYAPQEAANAVAALAARTTRQMVFTLAPRTPALSAMHAVGKLFPRSDRSPAIWPVAADRLIADVLGRKGLEDWQAGAPKRVSKGFYISEVQELCRR